VRWAIEKLLILFRFDKWAGDVGMVNFLERGGVRSQPSTIISRIIFWILIVTFFSFGLTYVGLPQFTEYASRITSALPYIVISTIIVIVGMIFSTFLSRVIYMACENANIGYGEVISKSVRIFLVVITFGIVFEYMGIGSTIISISFLIIFGGVILALSRRRHRLKRPHHRFHKRQGERKQEQEEKGRGDVRPLRTPQGG